jgi:hypothetical protein
MAFLSRQASPRALLLLTLLACSSKAHDEDSSGAGTGAGGATAGAGGYAGLAQSAGGKGGAQSSSAGSAGAVDTFWQHLKLGSVGAGSTPVRLYLVTPSHWVRVHGASVGSSDFQMFVTYDAGTSWQTLSSGFFTSALVEQFFFVLGIGPNGQLLARWKMESLCPLDCNPPAGADPEKTYLLGFDEPTRSWSILGTFPDGFDQSVPGEASGDSSQGSGINQMTASSSKAWISGASSAAFIQAWDGTGAWETFARPSMVNGELAAAPNGDLYLATSSGASTLFVRHPGDVWAPSLTTPVNFKQLVVDDHGPLYGIAPSGFYRRTADGGAFEARTPAVDLAAGEQVMWLAGGAQASGAAMLANYVSKTVSTTTTSARHVYLSRDGGGTWLEHSSGLTEADIAEIEFDGDGRAYVILRTSIKTSLYELWISPTPDAW